ncbi:MAG: hypothetical protein AABY22_28200 [Nanoarchaeota archaeon]
MKRISIFIFLLLFLPTIFALEVQIKDNYNRGETLILKISGIIDSNVFPENIFLYKGLSRIPVLYDVAKLQNEVYVYAILPETSGNYTIKIKDVTYRDGTKVITSDIERNFSISDNLAIFNVNPGYLVTNGNFSIKAHNLHNLLINIKVNSIFISPSDIIVKTGEEKNLEFKIPEGINATIYNIELSSQGTSYSIPILMTKSTPITLEKRSFRLSPSVLNLSLVQGDKKTFIAYIYNTGQKDITNISLFTEDFDNTVVLDTTEIATLPAGQNQKIKLFIYPNQTRTLRGNIVAETEELTTNLQLTLNIYKDNSQIQENESERQNYYEEDRTCRNINGVFCSQNQKCICNETVVKGGRCEEQFLEGTCCLGSCQIISEPEKKSKSSLLGWFIVLILVVAVFWFLRKQFSKS